MATVDQVFRNYPRYITIAFLNQFGASYATQDEIRNKWRYDYPYSVNARDFLIAESRNFYHTLDMSTPESTSPTFLLALAKVMADYLSAYTMRRVSGSQNKKDVRKNEKASLVTALFDECDYIQNLLRAQAKQREARRNKSGRFAQGELNTKKRAADKRLRSDIDDLFAEAKGYRGKTH